MVQLYSSRPRIHNVGLPTEMNTDTHTPAHHLSSPYIHHCSDRETTGSHIHHPHTGNLVEQYTWEMTCSHIHEHHTGNLMEQNTLCSNREMTGSHTNLSETGNLVKQYILFTLWVLDCKLQYQSRNYFKLVKYMAICILSKITIILPCSLLFNNGLLQMPRNYKIICEILI